MKTMWNWQQISRLYQRGSWKKLFTEQQGGDLWPPLWQWCCAFQHNVSESCQWLPGELGPTGTGLCNNDTNTSHFLSDWSNNDTNTSHALLFDWSNNDTNVSHACLSDWSNNGTSTFHTLLIIITYPFMCYFSKLQHIAHFKQITKHSHNKLLQERPHAHTHTHTHIERERESTG